MIEDVERKGRHTAWRCGRVRNERLGLLSRWRAIIEVLVIPVAAVLELGELRAFGLNGIM